jgi:uncharacterized delta-60 repeat protein
MKRLALPIVSVLAATLVAAPLGAPAHAGDGGPGALDASFGNDGVVVTDLGALETGNAIAVGTRIVVAATVQTDFVSGSDQALVSYLLDGTLDPSFGSGGVVVSDFEELDSPEDMTFDADDRILVLVSVGEYSDTRGAILVRYLADGTLDGSFGDQGVVDVGTDLNPSSVVVQPDGRIVVAARDPIVLSRYLPDGQPDEGFGEDGRVITELGTPNDWAMGLGVLPDGKLLVIGRTAWLRNEEEGEFKLVFIRYRQGGALDRSFGDRGVVRRHIQDWAEVADSEVTPRGKIVVLLSNLSGGPALWRFREDGKADTTFDRNGRAHVSVFSARRLALQAGGRILVLGETCVPNDVSCEPAPALSRYGADGSIDERFRTDETVLELIEGGFSPMDLVLQSKDRVLVVGSRVADFIPEDLAIARYFAA